MKTPTLPDVLQTLKDEGFTHIRKVCTSAMNAYVLYRPQTLTPLYDVLVVNFDDIEGVWRIEQYHSQFELSPDATPITEFGL